MRVSTHFWEGKWKDRAFGESPIIALVTSGVNAVKGLSTPKRQRRSGSERSRVRRGEAQTLTDGESDLKAKAAIQSSKDFPLWLLSKYLKRELPPNITVLDSGSKFWDSGISFVKVGANHIFDNAFIEAGPNLLVCSDIFTKYRGWVEGGIASAKAASEHLLLNRPFNSE